MLVDERDKFQFDFSGLRVYGVTAIWWAASRHPHIYKRVVHNFGVKGYGEARHVFIFRNLRNHHVKFVFNGDMILERIE